LTNDTILTNFEFFRMDDDEQCSQISNASPPQIKRELVCPNAPQRPIAITPKSNISNAKEYTRFPSTCVWKRLGLKQMIEETNAEQRKLLKRKHVEQS